MLFETFQNHTSLQFIPKFISEPFRPAATLNLLDSYLMGTELIQNIFYRKRCVLTSSIWAMQTNLSFSEKLLDIVREAQRFVLNRLSDS